ncbi:MAG: cyanophycinase [Flavobacteriales bacterium]|nr:cyanophycinase [Flavobacteriales bacterium]MBP9079395.1 cyanophycinase [Flavobacteriales bacterium]
MARFISLVALAASLCAQAQDYTSWFTGNADDAAPPPLGGTCMMGGASEFDPAMQWFLGRANGGDVLVLRASGADGYNDYMYYDLGGVNSVETIRFNNAAASNDPYVAQRIQKAEAIWFAGGDQWNYVDFWRNTPVMGLINAAISERHIAIGGTSAGMAILGGCYFSAQYGSITSAEALADPFGPLMAVDCTPFLDVPFMARTITDTHYDNPDRRGRHFTFLARMVQQGDSTAFGIACNEYVAVCVTPEGMAKVYGEWPDYEEYAWFMRVNCASPVGPEVCGPGLPLTWDRQAMAVNVYKVPATPNGANWLDLDDHLSGQGGTWEDWSAVAGDFATVAGEQPPCGPTTLIDEWHLEPLLQWDAGTRRALVRALVPGSVVQLVAADGRVLERGRGDAAGQCQLTVPMNGMVVLRALGTKGYRTWKLVR